MDYRATLNLPQTDFPMKANMAEREPEILKMWEEKGAFFELQMGSKKNLELIEWLIPL